MEDFMKKLLCLLLLSSGCFFGVQAAEEGRFPHTFVNIFTEGFAGYKIPFLRYIVLPSQEYGILNGSDYDNGLSAPFVAVASHENIAKYIIDALKIKHIHNPDMYHKVWSKQELGKEIKPLAAFYNNYSNSN